MLRPLGFPFCSEGRQPHHVCFKYVVPSLELKVTQCIHPLLDFVFLFLDYFEENSKIGGNFIFFLYVAKIERTKSKFKTWF